MLLNRRARGRRERGGVAFGRWPAVLHNVVAGKHKLLERWDENIFDKLEGGEIMKDLSACVRAALSSSS